MDLLDLGTLPISDAKPAGTDARYEPEYDALQQEIDKLSSATAGGGIDWKQVVKLAYVILSKKSKDIKVASYLAVALIHLKGVEGVSVGAKILLDLVNTYWDTMFPAKKRIRGRFNAVTWWSDNAETFLRRYEGDEIPQATSVLLNQRLADLDSALAAISDDAPMLRQLMGYAQGLPVQAPEVQAEKQAEKEAQAQVEEHQQATDAAVEAAARPSQAPAAPTPAANPAPVGNIGSHEEYREALKNGLGGLGVVGDYLMVNDPADRIGYRLRRIVAWMPIAALPPGDKGKTLIPPPDAQVKDTIVNLLDNRDFVSALQAAESRVGQFLFWLDLSRLASEALDGLGGDFRKAMLAVEAEVALFVKRLPGLISMTFSDGTPFADRKTRAWIKSLNREGGGPAVGGDVDSVSAKAFAEASKLAKDKKIFDAVTVLQNSLNSTPSGRERFMLRLGMIRLLTDVDQSALAHSHVEEVIEHINEYRLEQWEPDLALNGYRAAYEALSAEGGDEALNMAKKTLQRIGRLSPAAALKINGLN